MICNRWDIVVVPFPFTERLAEKRRPALALSNEEFNSHGHTILSMITTKADPPWPGDTEIKQYKSAGLRIPCIVRLKLFTLDNRLILRRIGQVAEEDFRNIEKNMRRFLI